jgi:small subunit ribosomal protein S21
MAIVVKADPGDTTTQVIRKFKKVVQQDQILTDIKEREFYKRPSVLKSEKTAERRRRRKSRRRSKS